MALRSITGRAGRLDDDYSEEYIRHERMNKRAGCHIDMHDTYVFSMEVTAMQGKLVSLQHS